MRHHACLLIAVLAACTPQTDALPDSTPAAPAPAPVDPNASPSGVWAVTPAGIGAVRVEMTSDELRRAAGDFTAPSAGSTCAYVRPASLPPGASVMLANGRVARIDVDSTGVRTDAGIAVGDSSAAVARAYEGRVTTMPHKYVSGGEYLIVRPSPPSDSTLRIVFESEGGRVTRYRSGRVPEVEWVERCG